MHGVPWLPNPNYVCNLCNHLIYRRADEVLVNALETVCTNEIWSYQKVHVVEKAGFGVGARFADASTIRSGVQRRETEIFPGLPN